MSRPYYHQGAVEFSIPPVPTKTRIEVFQIPVQGTEEEYSPVTVKYYLNKNHGFSRPDLVIEKIAPVDGVIHSDMRYDVIREIEQKEGTMFNEIDYTL